MKSLREDEVEDLAVGRGEILCQSETSDMRLSSLTWHGPRGGFGVEKVKRKEGGGKNGRGGWRAGEIKGGQRCPRRSTVHSPQQECGFTLHGKLLRAERRTNEEEVGKERWEMRVVRAQGVLEK